MVHCALTGREPGDKAGGEAIYNVHVKSIYAYITTKYVLIVASYEMYYVQCCRHYMYLTIRGRFPPRYWVWSSAVAFLLSLESM